jgi:hypothetical protein
MHPTAPVQRKCKCFSNGTMDRRPKPYQSTPKTCSHFELAHSFRRFTACCMQANYDYAVNDRTTDTMSPQQASLARRETKWGTADVFPNGHDLDRRPTPSEFDINCARSAAATNNARITRASLDRRRRHPTAELLLMHYKFGHRLRAMARNGVLSKSLEDSPLPVCPACLYGKAEKRATQNKTKKSINPARQS